MLSKKYLVAVLQIRDVYPIPRSEFFHPGSRVKKILDPGSGSSSKILSIFNQENVFSPRKYDPGCSSRIRILILYSSWIPDLGILDPDPPHSLMKFL
jgi:hypothetical protein